MMRQVVRAAVMAVAMLASAPAAASDADRASETSWYGWQTLAIDAAAATTMVVGVATAPRGSEGAASLLLPSRALGEDAPRSTTTLDVGLALYTLGPAVVHSLHGRPLASVGSTVIRSVGPTAGAFVGAVVGVVLALPLDAFGPDPDPGAGIHFGPYANAVLRGSIATGAVLGALGPMVLDAGALAREPAAKANEVPKDPALAIRWQPQLGYTKSGPSVGLAGTF